MSWWIIVVAVLAAAWWREHRAARTWQSAAEHYRDACIRAEHALSEIANMEEIETGTQTIMTDSALAARLGIDNKIGCPKLHGSRGRISWHD